MVERHTIAIGDGKWIGYCLVAMEYALMTQKNMNMMDMKWCPQGR
jgi:hypothetical protein